MTRNSIKRVCVNEISGLEDLEHKADAQRIRAVVNVDLGLAYVDASMAEQQDNNEELAGGYMKSAQSLFQSLGWHDYSEDTLRHVAKAELDIGGPERRKKRNRGNDNCRKKSHTSARCLLDCQSARPWDSTMLRSPCQDYLSLRQVTDPIVLRDFSYLQYRYADPQHAEAALLILVNFLEDMEKLTSGQLTRAKPGYRIHSVGAGRGCDT